MLDRHDEQITLLQGLMERHERTMAQCDTAAKIVLTWIIIMGIGSKMMGISKVLTILGLLFDVWGTLWLLMGAQAWQAVEMMPWKDTCVGRLLRCLLSGRSDKDTLQGAFWLFVGFMFQLGSAVYALVPSHN